MQHKKSAIWKYCKVKMAQHKKSATWKECNHEKSTIHEKGSIYYKGGTWRKYNIKRLHCEKSVTGKVYNLT